MASLDDFLKAEDLDDLLKIRGQMGGLCKDDVDQVSEVLRDWKHGQAISNLLFHPSLIPEPLRLNSIDRSLRSTEEPYFALAAVAGLQSIHPDSVPVDVRKRWVTALLEIIRSDGELLSSRASVTIWPWLRGDEVGEFVRAYPVPDENAAKNILAFAIARFGELAPSEYRNRLRECGVGFWKRRHFIRRYEEYRRKQDAGEAAVFMKMPLLSYIPNYGSVER